MEIIYKENSYKKRISSLLLTGFSIIICLFAWFFGLIGGILTEKYLFIFINIVAIIIFLLMFILLIYLITTTKEFIIYSTGIQYPIKSAILNRNYKSNYIPYENIKEIRLAKYNYKFNMHIIDNKNWRFVIPCGIIGSKKNKKWNMDIPFKEILNIWSKKKNKIVKRDDNHKDILGFYYRYYLE